MKKVQKIVYTKKQMYLYLQNDKGIMSTRDYRAYINIVEAYVQRGMEYIYLNARWHSSILSWALNNYHLAREELNKAKDSEKLKEIEKVLLKYISLLRKEKKISAKKGFRKSLEIKHPKINNILGKTFTPLKKKIKYILKEKKQLKNDIEKSDFLLFNTVTHGNLGDHTIVLAQNQVFSHIKKDCKILDLTGKQVEENLKRLKHLVPRQKTIFVCGGGNIGYLWPLEEKRLRDIVKTFPQNKIVFFPQTTTFDMKSEDGIRFFEESKKIYSSHKNLTLFVREQMSLDFMRGNMPEVDCRLVPDIVLCYKPQIEEKTRNGLLICLRSDKEKAMSEESFERLLQCVGERFEKSQTVFTDTTLDRNIFAEEREEAVTNKLRQFASSELVITDRLHGMVFAFLTKTPCIALGNSNGKVKAVYQWIKDCPFVKYIDSVEELPKTLEELNETDKEYSFDMKNFALLTQLIKEEVE